MNKKSVDPPKPNINSKITIKIPKSPIRLTIKAFKAALFALKRVNQKFISKYEAKPTPSQPIKSCIKFPDVTSTNIKKVKMLKKEIKRGK